jgi:hypothetical protein
MSQLRVYDAPVARDTDPITSTIAGENQAAREASEQAVLNILTFNAQINGKPMTAHDIVVTAHLGGAPWTEQRLRTALAQLGRKGIIQHAGRRDAASPTGRSAQTWKLAQR